MKEKRLLSGVAFDFAVKQTRCAGSGAKAARDVLVGGMSNADAAKKHGTTRQNVNRVVNRISQSALRLGSCPMCGRKH
jgi:hypothetical protein